MSIRRGFVAVMLGLVILGGVRCAGTAYLDSAYAGRTQAYEPGVPNFDLVASPTIQDGQTGIDIYLGIPHASLIFVPRVDSFQARFEILYRLLDADAKNVLAEYTDADTVHTPDYTATQTYAPFLKQRRLAVEPGTYVVEVVVMDAESKQEARRRQRIEVIAAGGARPVLSALRMEGKRAGYPFEPVLSLHLPAGLDSLRSIVELYNAAHLGDVGVTMRLLHFPSDTAAAQPPYWFTLANASALVRYDSPDTLQVTRRLIQDLDQEIVIEFDLPGLDEGVYRIEIEAEEEASAVKKAALRRHRDFAVRSADFPHVASLDVLIEALTYLAEKKEYNHLREAKTMADKKQRFDAFWGALVANRNVAANMVERYYERVEEANLRFTTYKEGWKTDRGMVYILFGPPVYIDDHVNREVWYYTYDDRDGQRAFTFERYLLYPSDGIFDVYLLQRGPHLEPAWRQAFDRWRRGDML